MKLVKLYESVLIENEIQSCITKGGVENIKSCISKHPEILEPSGVVYKAGVMTLSDLLGQYYDISDDFKTGGVFDFTYKSKLPVQSWTRDRDAAEGLAEVSPFLLQTIRTYGNVKDNPEGLNEFIKGISLDNITVPIIIKLDANSDDLLFNSKLIKSLSIGEYKDELLRVNDRPTRVSAEIIEPLFQSVFELLRAIKQYEVRLHQQG